MNKLTIKASKREVLGRKVKGLRKAGQLPANVFGKKIKSEAISMKLSDFQTVYKEAGETGLINLFIEGEKQKEGRAVLVSNLQMDPVSDKPIHVDLRQVDLKEKVTAEVPVEVIGESPAEKTGIGTVVQYIDEFEVEALPGDLPEQFTIDASLLSEVDQAIYVKDIKVDSSKIAIKEEADAIVVKVEPPQKEEEVAPPPAEEAIPVEGEEKEAETVEGEGEKKETPEEQPQPEGKP
jgi:large subunit ribosomal protein L25